MPEKFTGEKIIFPRSATLPSAKGSMITSFQLFQPMIIAVNQPRSYGPCFSDKKQAPTEGKRSFCLFIGGVGRGPVWSQHVPDLMLKKKLLPLVIELAVILNPSCFAVIRIFIFLF